MGQRCRWSVIGSLLELVHEFSMELAELAKHHLQLVRLRQNGGAEVESVGALPETGAGNNADALKKTHTNYKSQSQL